MDRAHRHRRCEPHAGVIAVLTSDNYMADDLKARRSAPVRTERCHQGPAFARRRARPVAPQFPLAPERVRFPGEAVAVVVAESTAAGTRCRRGGWGRLRRAAGGHRCPRRRPSPNRSGRRRPDNIALDQEFGDAAEVDAAFASADLVVEQTSATSIATRRWSRARESASYDGQRHLHADLRQPGRPRAAHGAGRSFGCRRKRCALSVPMSAAAWAAQQSLSRAGRDPKGGRGRPSGEIQRPVGMLPHRLRGPRTRHRGAAAGPAGAASPPTRSNGSALRGSDRDLRLAHAMRIAWPRRSTTCR